MAGLHRARSPSPRLLFLNKAALTCIFSEPATEELSPAVQARSDRAERTFHERRDFFVRQCLDVAEYHDRAKLIGE
jgi:hypothetical protein